MLQVLRIAVDFFPEPGRSRPIAVECHIVLMGRSILAFSRFYRMLAPCYAGLAECGSTSAAPCTGTTLKGGHDAWPENPAHCHSTGHGLILHASTSSFRMSHSHPSGGGKELAGVEDHVGSRLEVDARPGTGVAERVPYAQDLQCEQHRGKPESAPSERYAAKPDR